jgi:hypothetical protein
MNRGRASIFSLLSLRIVRRGVISRFQVDPGNELREAEPPLTEGEHLIKKSAFYLLPA